MVNLLGELIDAIVREYQPQKVILFGSHAWGKPDCDSQYLRKVISGSSQSHLSAMRRSIQRRRSP